MLTWLLMFGVATIGVRAGLALLTGGAVQQPSAAATLLRSATEAAAAGLAFWAVGAPLLLGRPGGLLSFDPHLILTQSTDSPRLAISEAYHWAVALIGGAVVAGAVAERAKARVGIVASAVLGGVVFPVVGHWIWFGWLRERFFVDDGGATAVHLTAAVFAAVAVAMVGSRPGRYDPARRAEPFAPHSWPLVAVGVALLLVGWTPYLLGGLIAHPTEFNSPDASATALAALAVMNIALAGTGGLLGGLAYARVRRARAGNRPDLFCGYAGLLGGLVAISSGCVAVGNMGGLLIGLAAGVAVPAAAAVLDRRARLDDPTGLIAIHGVGAAWGVLATAMFAANQSRDRHAQLELFAVQALGLAATLAFAAVAAAVTFALLRAVGSLREE